MARTQKTKRKRNVDGNALSIALGYDADLSDFDPSSTQEERECAEMNALNWLNMMATPNKERSWAIKYFKNKQLFTATEIARIRVMDASVFNRLGRICHMVTKGFPQDTWIDEKIQGLVEKVTKKLNHKSEKNDTENDSVNVQEKMNEKASNMAAVLLCEIDSFTTTLSERKKAEDGSFFNVSSWVNQNELKGRILSRMIPIIEFDKKQFEDALSIAEIREAYPQFTDSELKRIVSFYDSVIEGLEGEKTRKKATRKPRKRKAVPAIKQVEKIQYLSEFDGVKSIAPSKIIGASKLITYNTKTRFFSIFESVDKAGFTVKGTTLYGFDSEKSTQKKIREQYQKDLLNVASTQGIRAIKNSFNAIRSKESVPNGRINKDCILVSVLT